LALHFRMNDKNCLLQVENLSVGFHIDKKQDIFLENVSFNLYKGKTLALVGESGSGKTLSALSILGLLPYPIAFHPTGSIKFFKSNNVYELLNKSENYLKEFRGIDIGMVFQEPQSALNPLHTVGSQVSEPLIIHGKMNKKDALDYSIYLLEDVELKNAASFLKCYPHQLSGGQRQRVMIAQAIACKPSILIADEPTTALDVTIQEGIIHLLKKLSKTHDMATLLISHDLQMVQKLADDICIMKNGRIVENGNCAEVFNNPQNAYTKKLLACMPSGYAKPLVDQPREIIKASKISLSYAKKGLFSFFKKENTYAVKEASLTLKEGETLGIVGESGSGKTSLLFAILNLLNHEGKVHFKGLDVQSFSKNDMRKLRQNMQVIFQDPFGALNPRLTIREIIEEGILVHFPQCTSLEKEEKILDVLKDVQLTPDILNRYPHEFSGGQRQRISIARSIILKPSFLALDEPTSALDRSIQKEILDMLKSLQEKYKLSYLFVSHDLAVVRSLSHRMIIMKEGKIIEEGETQEILQNPQQDYTKKLFKAAFG
jgi:microcin C transport system ATP-binding protein